MHYESENTEYKSCVTDELYKEVIAFANSGGGTIYAGVDDEGNELGLDNVDEAYTRLTNGIRDAISPDVTMFINYTLQNNDVIRIDIAEGSFKPYYLKGKGLEPSGVYIRQGASKVQASPDQIRRMIKASDGDEFEEMRSINQELDFAEAEKAFERYKVDFSEDKFIALGIRSIKDAQYTNLGMILSDQCPYTIKIAVFDDEEETVFKDAKEFGGSVFRQLEDSFAYLALCNRRSASFSGLERIEKTDYPEAAVRETLLNALIHRDYSYSGSIIINVTERHMEFISLGGLLPGLSAEDIRSGISQPRNRKLAEVFYRLRLIESYGTGIRRIYSLYKNCTQQPVIEITPNVFKLILPNANVNEAGRVSTAKAFSESTAPYGVPMHEPQSAAKLSASRITPQMKMILEHLKEHDGISDEEVQELLGIRKTRAYLITRQMADEGLIRIDGRGRDKRYKL